MTRAACWIFTADDQVDRRIFAHVPPLRRLGLEPLIFAADWAGAAVNPVPVLRPADPPARPRTSRRLLGRWFHRRRLRRRQRQTSVSLNPERLAARFPEFQREVYDFLPLHHRCLRVWKSGESQRPDLILAIDLPVLPVALAWADWFAVPLAIDCHECWAEQAAIFSPQRPAASRIAHEWETRLYPLCDLRITVGEELARMMAERFSCPFSVVYSSCNPPADVLRRPGSFWQTRAGWPPGTSVAIFQGRLTPYRNLELLLEACRYLQPGQAVAILGDGPLAEPLRQKARDAGLDGVFRLFGHIAQDELLEWTAQGMLGLLPHVTVNPYFSCSAPNKLFEYIAAGLPMIYDPGMTEIAGIVGRYGFGTALRCHRPETLGRGIAALLANRTVLDGYRENLQKFGRRYHADVQAERFAAAVEAIL